MNRPIINNKKLLQFVKRENLKHLDVYFCNGFINGYWTKAFDSLTFNWSRRYDNPTIIEQPIATISLKEKILTIYPPLFNDRQFNYGSCTCWIWLIFTQALLDALVDLRYLAQGQVLVPIEEEGVECTLTINFIDKSFEGAISIEAPLNITTPLLTPPSIEVEELLNLY